jgi:hypothetical protein
MRCSQHWLLVLGIVGFVTLRSCSSDSEADAGQHEATLAPQVTQEEGVSRPASR